MRDGHDEVVWVAAGTNTRVVVRKPNAASAAGWVPLFNGRDLAGSKTHPEQPGHWRGCEGGNLVGSGPGAVSHLFSEHNDCEDLPPPCRQDQLPRRKGDVLRRQWHLLPGLTDAGQDGSLSDRLRGQIFCRRVDATVARGKRNRTGSLYGLERYERIVPGADAGEWFTMEVIARGPRITIKVNDVTAWFEDSSYQRGHFALQQASAETVIQFRKIEVKELSAAQSESSGVSPNAGVLTLRFEPGDYSEKVRRFGVVVQIRNAGNSPGTTVPQVVRVGEKVATTYVPGEYTLEISEPGEVELSRHPG